MFALKNKFLNFNRFSLMSLKISSFKSNWFDLKREILNFDWCQKMSFFKFRKYNRNIILHVTCSKYFWNIQISRIFCKKCIPVPGPLEIIIFVFQPLLPMLQRMFANCLFLVFLQTEIKFLLHILFLNQFHFFYYIYGYMRSR